MSTSIIRPAKLFCCPYCPRTGEGSIIVDMEELSQMALRGDRGDRDEVELFSAESGTGAGPWSVVVCNPHGVPNRPCPHMIYLSVSLSVGYGAEGAHEPTLNFNGIYRHAWFAAHDPTQMCECWLANIARGAAGRPHPTSPHWFGLPVKRRVLQRSRQFFSISGFVVVALHPELFLVELKDSARRGDGLFCDRGNDLNP